VQRSGLSGELELDKRVVARLRGQGYSGLAVRAGRYLHFPEGGIDISQCPRIEHVDNTETVIGRVSLLSPGASLPWKRPTATVWMAALPAYLLGWLHTSPVNGIFFTPRRFPIANAQWLGSAGHSFSNRPSFWNVLPAPRGAHEGKSRPRAGAWFDPMREPCEARGSRLFDLLRDSPVQRLQHMIRDLQKTS